MHDDEPNHLSWNFGRAILVWIAAFAASWTIFLALTGTPGLALVFSIFVALIAFDISRRSLSAAFSIFLASLLVILLAKIYDIAL